MLYYNTIPEKHKSQWDDFLQKKYAAVTGRRATCIAHCRNNWRVNGT